MDNSVKDASGQQFLLSSVANCTNSVANGVITFGTVTYDTELTPQKQFCRKRLIFCESQTHPFLPCQKYKSKKYFCWWLWEKSSVWWYEKPCVVEVCSRQRAIEHLSWSFWRWLTSLSEMKTTFSVSDWCSKSGGGGRAKLPRLAPFLWGYYSDPCPVNPAT